MASRIISSRSPGGRLLTIEWVDDLPSPSSYLDEIARHDGSHGFVVVTEDMAVKDSLPPQKPGDGALHVSILLRPTLQPRRGTLLSVLSALALVRTVRRHSAHEPMIRWVSDVFAGKRRIAAVATRAVLTQQGSYDYVIVNLALRITDSFAGSLTEVVESVFSSNRETLTERVAETLITEFFTLYEGFATTDSTAFLDEYRELSLLRGKRIRFWKDGKRYRATVIGIDDSAGLVVTPRRGRSVVLHSLGELHDTRRHKRQKQQKKTES